MFSLVFWIFVLVLGLSFFGISLESVLSSPSGQENFAYLLQLARLGVEWFVMTIQQFKQ